MKWITPLVFSLLFGLTGITQAALINGSFESGTSLPRLNYFKNLGTSNTSIEGWTITAGNLDWVGTGLWTASDNNYSLDLTGTTQGTISQTVATMAGQVYTLTFDLAGNPGFQGVTQLGVGTEDDSAVFSFDTTGKTHSDMGWITLSWRFTAQDEETTIRFWSLYDYNNAGAALDNVRMSATPVPNTVLLLGSGLLWLLGFSRRI